MPRKFELADKSQIEAFEEIAAKLFDDILGMDYSEILATDDSALSDFAGCGEACDDFPPELLNARQSWQERRERWSKWVIAKIAERYGVEIAGPGIYLVELFRRIKQEKKLPVQ
jgi:hypothetical protein